LFLVLAFQSKKLAGKQEQTDPKKHNGTETDCKRRNIRFGHYCSNNEGIHFRTQQKLMTRLIYKNTTKELTDMLSRDGITKQRPFH
jgi:hypothetical protein